MGIVHALLQVATNTNDSLFSLSPWLALIPLIVAPLTTFITQMLKKVSDGLDKAGPTVKRIVVAIIAIILNWVGLHFGVHIPGTVGEITPDAITTLIMGLLSAFGAMGIYHLPAGTDMGTASARRADHF